MIKGFGKFLMRGNVIDLAVAVVIGGAFGAVVAALVKDLLTPLIAAIAGKPDFSALAFVVNNSQFAYGNFINALLNFIFVSFAIYFFVVTPMNSMSARFGPKPAAPEPTKICPECVSEIPLPARRCKFCTAVLPS